MSAAFPSSSADRGAALTHLDIVSRGAQMRGDASPEDNRAHSPVGNVFSRAELEGIAQDYNLIVMSDEVVRPQRPPSRSCALGG